MLLTQTVFMSGSKAYYCEYEGYAYAEDKIDPTTFEDGFTRKDKNQDQGRYYFSCFFDPKCHKSVTTNNEYSFIE